MIKGVYEDSFVNVRHGQLTNSLIFIGVLILAVLVIVYFTTFVEQAQYKIPIQYTKIAQGAPSSSYLPLKVTQLELFLSSLLVRSQLHRQQFSRSLVPWVTMLDGFEQHNLC